jgi:hypothetical protein
MWLFAVDFLNQVFCKITYSMSTKAYILKLTENYGILKTSHSRHSIEKLKVLFQIIRVILLHAH